MTMHLHRTDSVVCLCGKHKELVHQSVNTDFYFNFGLDKVLLENEEWCSKCYEDTGFQLEHLARVKI